MIGNGTGLCPSPLSLERCHPRGSQGRSTARCRDGGGRCTLRANCTSSGKHALFICSMDTIDEMNYKRLKYRKNCWLAGGKASDPPDASSINAAAARLQSWHGCCELWTGFGVLILHLLSMSSSAFRSTRTYVQHLSIPYVSYVRGKRLSATRLESRCRDRVSVWSVPSACVDVTSLSLTEGV